MSNLQQEVRLSSGDEPILADYRPVSRLAILAIALAVLSPLALATPLLWVLPAAAAGFAVFALVAIARPDSSVVGRKAALAALTAACFFGAWAPARHFSWQATLDHDSLEFVNRWFDLIRQDQLDEAFHLHVSSRIDEPVELPPGMDQSQVPVDDEPPAEKFFKTPPYDALRRALSKHSVRHEGLTAVRYVAPYHQVVQRFIFIDPETNSDVKVRITTQLALQPGVGEPHWSIYNVATEYP